VSACHQNGQDERNAESTQQRTKDNKKKLVEQIYGGVLFKKKALTITRFF
jgi:hypothetical protein